MGPGAHKKCGCACIVHVLLYYIHVYKVNAGFWPLFYLQLKTKIQLNILEDEYILFSSNLGYFGGSQQIVDR